MANGMKKLIKTHDMKTSRYIWALAAMLTLVACSDSDTFDVADRNVKLRVSVGSESVFTRSNPIGTADEQKSFNNGDMVSVSNGTQTAVYTLSDNGWTITTGTLTWSEGSGMFQALYPADGTNTFDKGVIKTDQSTLANLAASDYMRQDYDYTSVPADRTLNLEMQRQTARVIFKVSYYKSQFDGRNPSIGYLHVFSPTETESNVRSEITAYQSGDEFVALVVPTAYDYASFVKLNVKTSDNASGTVLYVRGIPAMEPGKSYTYNLIVGKDEVSIADIEVTDWSNGAIIADGKLKPEFEVNGSNITINFEGMLAKNSDLIETAVGTGSTLKVSGPINKDDIEAIKNYLKTNSSQTLNLDLEDAVIGEFPDNALSGLENLGNVKLPKTLTSIGKSAFANSSNAVITNLNDLKSLQYIKELAFEDCTLSGNIVFECLLDVEAQAFYQVKANSLTFPESLFGCIQLETFCSAEIDTITFKGNIGGVDCNAFAETKITIYLSGCDAVPSCDDYAFYRYEGTLHVKSGLKSAFENAEGWREIVSNGGEIVDDL